MYQLTILFFSLLLIGPTPDSGEWNRCIFIGSNKDSYFVYLAKWNQPGSYYNSVDSVFLCKIEKGTNQLLERIFLREIAFEDTNGSQIQVVIRKTLSDFNVERNLLENNVLYAFPSTDFEKLQLTVSDEGIFLSNDVESKNIISLQILFDNQRWLFGRDRIVVAEKPDFLKYYKRLNRNLKISDCFRDKDTYYFVVQNGRREMEGEFYQFIVQKPASDLENIVKLFEKKK